LSLSNRFKGKRCEQPVNECESRPCLNDGICVQKSGVHPSSSSSSSVRLDESELSTVAAGDHRNHSFASSNASIIGSAAAHTPLDPDELGYLCKCLDGFDGAHCEINVDDCKK
jgi:hypothetical protein